MCVCVCVGGLLAEGDKDDILCLSESVLVSLLCLGVWLQVRVSSYAVELRLGVSLEASSESEFCLFVSHSVGAQDTWAHLDMWSYTLTVDEW